MEEITRALAENYRIWVLVLLSSVGISYVLTSYSLRLAKQKKLAPEIRDRDVHSEPKPRLGGVAMWLSFTLVSLVLLSALPVYNFDGPALFGVSRVLWGIGLGLILLLLTGLLDDLRGLSPAQQLLGQFLAATAVIWGGVQVEYIRLPFEGVLTFTQFSTQLPTWLGAGILYPLGALVTYLWIMTIINVMNFFDGLDGLAGSVATTAAVVMFLVCLRLNLLGPALLALVLAGVTLGFLPWNWHPSKLFMGTVGSQMLGFILAVTAIVSGAKVATAVLVLGIPVLDAIIVVFRRLLAGVSPFEADQRHLHHRLLKIGMSVPAVVITINAIAIIFGMLALRTQNAAGKGMLTLLLIGAMFLVILATYLLERRATRRVH